MEMNSEKENIIHHLFNLLRTNKTTTIFMKMIDFGTPKIISLTKIMRKWQDSTFLDIKKLAKSLCHPRNM